MAVAVESSGLRISRPTPRDAMPGIELGEILTGIFGMPKSLDSQNREKGCDFIGIYIYKLCPLVVYGIFYIDDTKDYSLLGL